MNILVPREPFLYHRANRFLFWNSISLLQYPLWKGTSQGISREISLLSDIAISSVQTLNFECLLSDVRFYLHFQSFTHFLSGTRRFFFLRWIQSHRSGRYAPQSLTFSRHRSRGKLRLYFGIWQNILFVGLFFRNLIRRVTSIFCWNFENAGRNDDQNSGDWFSLETRIY
jgi:hypothetical protein